MRVAEAFERMNLRLEALTEYQEIARLPINEQRQMIVRERVEALRKKSGDESR